MKLLGINHVGLAPKDPKMAKWFFGEALESDYLGEEFVAEQKTNTHIYKTDTESRISLMEILEERGGDDGPIGKYIEKKGGGIHHVALDVDDIEAFISRLLSKGVTMIDKVPRQGVCQTKIAFVHPKSTGGLLVELVERQ